MTAKEIKKKYTRVSKIDDSWTAYLFVGCQSFSVCENTTRKRAQWYARMLSIALERLVREANNTEMIDSFIQLLDKYRHGEIVEIDELYTRLRDMRGG